MVHSPYRDSRIPDRYANRVQSFHSGGSGDESTSRYFLLAKQAEGCSRTTLATLKLILSDLHHFCISSGIGLPIDQLNQEHLVTYLVDLQSRDNRHCHGKRLAPSTVNKHWRGLSVFYNWLYDNHRIQAIPLQGIKTPRADKTLIATFNEGHVRKMLDLCPNTKPWGIRDRAIILTFLLTGIRRDEISRMTISDMNFDEHYIRIFGKGRKERRVFMDSRLITAMIQWLMIRPHTDHDRTFVSMGKKDCGQPLSSGAFLKLVSRLGKYANIDDIRCSPHTFRHTFAINLLRAGKDIRFVQAVMGHETLRSTEIYLRTLAQEDAISFHQNAMPFREWHL